MKQTLAMFPLLAAAVVFALAAMPLSAQTNLATNAPTTSATAEVVAAPPPAAAPADDANSDFPFSSALHMLIPIIAIVMGCSIPIVIVVAVCYFKHRKTQMVHETVRAMVEKGVPVPPEMFAKAGGEWQQNWPPGGNPFPGAFGPPPPRNDLRTGLLMTGLGAGLVIFLGSPGWIALFLGVAFILVSFFDKKKPAPDQPPKP